MKIFKVIWKAWLQHRVYKYTLKYEDFSSKSNRFRRLARNYQAQSDDAIDDVGEDSKHYNLSATKYFNKSDHCAHLAKMYRNKKLDLEKELQCYRKV